MNYDDLQKLLDDNSYLITVSELQGLLMGFYAAGLSVNEQSWKKQLLRQLSVSEPMPEAIESELVALNSTLQEMICTDIFGLVLLLPSDETTTVVRGEALGYWCQGFLLGYLQLSETKDEQDEDVIDAFSDMEEISNLDLESIGNSEEDEKMLFQITEHIKVAAQIIHSTYGHNPSDENPSSDASQGNNSDNKNETLH